MKTLHLSADQVDVLRRCVERGGIDVGSLRECPQVQALLALKMLERLSGRFHGRLRFVTTKKALLAIRKAGQ